VVAAAQRERRAGGHRLIGEMDHGDVVIAAMAVAAEELQGEAGVEVPQAEGVGRPGRAGLVDHQDDEQVVGGA
jgi:hypothetical protein